VTANDSAMFVEEAIRRTPVHGEYDVVVVGGGPSGIAAAAAAASHGCRTLLIERYGFLGGMGTAAGVTNFFGLYANVYGEIRQVVHGICDELLERIDRLGGLNEPHIVFNKTKARAYDTAIYKCAAYQLLLAKGVDVLFHALAVGVVMKPDGEIGSLLVETKSGRRAVLGKIFIDCSGDADLAKWAGAPFAMGDDAGNLLYPTMTFRVNGVAPAAAGDAWRTIRPLMARAMERGRSLPGTHAVLRPQRNPIEWRVNVTKVKNPDGRAVNGCDALELSAGEIEGRRQAIEFFDFLRQDVPGFRDAYIVDIPPQLGVRETRRIVGEYQVSGDDIMSFRQFDDSIGVNGLPIDNYIAESTGWEWPDPSSSIGTFDLPYRMLLPMAVSNLLVAGRCASTTHEGQSATRASGACFVMGQAAGTAASLAVANNISPARIAAATLRPILERDGVYFCEVPAVQKRAVQREPAASFFDSGPAIASGADARIFDREAQ
jgi:hypothetical protein